MGTVGVFQNAVHYPQPLNPVKALPHQLTCPAKTTEVQDVVQQTPKNCTWANSYQFVSKLSRFTSFYYVLNAPFTKHEVLGPVKERESWPRVATLVRWACEESLKKCVKTWCRGKCVKTIVVLYYNIPTLFDFTLGFRFVLNSIATLQFEAWCCRVDHLCDVLGCAWSTTISTGLASKSSWTR